MIKRSLVILTVLTAILFTSCSNNQLKEESVEMIHTTILTDSDISFMNLIDEGFPLNYVDLNGDSLLSKAIKYDSRRIVKKIIEKDKSLINPEMIFSARSLYVFDSLIKNGNISLEIKNSDGEPLIHYLIKNKLDELLIYCVNSGIKLDSLDRKGWEPLFWAAEKGSREGVILLLKSGVTPLKKDSKGNHPIYYAKDAENIRALYNYNYRMSDTNIDNEVISGEVLFNAVKTKDIDLVRALIVKGYDKSYKSYGKSIVDIAKEGGDLPMVEFLNSLGVQ